MDKGRDEEASKGSRGLGRLWGPGPRWTLLALALAAAVFLLANSSRPISADGPTLTVSPTTAAPGDPLIIQGSGYDPNAGAIRLQITYN